MLSKVKQLVDGIISGPNMVQCRPEVDSDRESNSLGFTGDLAGAPVIKLAMAQGFEVLEAHRRQIRRDRHATPASSMCKRAAVKRFEFEMLPLAARRGVCGIWALRRIVCQ